MTEKQIAKYLTEELVRLGFVVHKYNAVTTDSIYLKLDYGFVVVFVLVIIKARKNIIIDLML